MHKAKQISERVKNSRYNTYIQKEGPLDKSSCRPISIQLFQIFSKEFYLINYPAFQKIFLPLFCEFRKVWITQYVIINLLQNGKSALMRFKNYWNVINGLSKVYDYVNFDLIIAKLET